MSENTTDTKVIEYKIRIQPVFRKKCRILSKLRVLVQNRPVFVGLQIKNIDNKCTPQINISKLKILPAEGSQVSNDFSESLNVPEINPGQEVTLWWPNAVNLVMKGQAWIECSLTALSEDKCEIVTHQYNNACGVNEPHLGPSNRWGDALLIRGELEQQQAITNMWMFVLTLLVFLDGIIGLKHILNTCLKIGKMFIEYLLNMITKSVC